MSKTGGQSTIWDSLDDEILNEIIKEAESIFGKKTLVQAKETGTYFDFVLEFALFHHFVDDDLLIDFVNDNLIELDDVEQKQLEALNDSERLNLKFIKKIKRNKLDTKGRELYDFYFQDPTTTTTKIIVSSTKLEKNGSILNMRTMLTEEYDKDRYVVIGAIYNEKSASAIEQLDQLTRIQHGYKESLGRLNYLMVQSQALNEEEITKWDDKKSQFLEQDRQIMLINKKFYQKFDLNIDEFIQNFAGLSTENCFEEMCNYYLSIYGDLEKVIYNTNYQFGSIVFTLPGLIKAFLGFIINNRDMLKEGIIELQEEAKKDFDCNESMALSASREKIMENHLHLANEYFKKWSVREDISKDLIDNKEKQLNKLKAYTPIEIKKFIKEVIKWTREEEPENEEEIISKEMQLSWLEALKGHSDIPYLKDIDREISHYPFRPELFYEYLDENHKDVYVLSAILYAVYLFNINEARKSYELITQLQPETDECFEITFFIGKILSFFENKNYQKYFNQAKRLDKERYKAELSQFLKEKEASPQLQKQK